MNELVENNTTSYFYQKSPNAPKTDAHTNRGTATIRDNSTKKHLNFMKYIEYVNAIADDYVLLIHFLFNG
ncbi:hypothetical protein CW740_06165 [Kangiella profundi]|uniref:Uncharacterized protein n=1 Tax=Kangiella profundi TaxID=1561924 RepID=A0A2K9AIV0_9GAMM|nr:hypothetical protein [Kangiella profundi]AUD78854.1 hypothetical protein CW740_06165 [Kangiella profundi]GGF03541.1 hypothetical protein GCM10011356_16600 [Kangiella profundi]